jgi:transcriptional regulator with XRE-family HTH domain
VDPADPKESGYSASLLAQEVGRRIKEARLERGLSRRDFGARLGVSGQQIDKYESGKDAVPLHRLLTLASICGVPPQDFWNHADTAAATPGISGAADIATIELVRAYRRIGDAKVRRRLLQLVKQMAGDDEESAGS